MENANVERLGCGDHRTRGACRVPLESPRKYPLFRRRRRSSGAQCRCVPLEAYVALKTRGQGGGLFQNVAYCYFKQ
jgi:hypothetical protein